MVIRPTATTNCGWFCCVFLLANNKLLFVCCVCLLQLSHPIVVSARVLTLLVALLPFALPRLVLMIPQGAVPCWCWCGAKA
jgi:hypothetical protein